MLVFLLTDLKVSREELRAALPVAVAPSFNSISVDGDMSTSDTVLLVSSGQGPSVEADAFRSALAEVCGLLAQDVVRNGEGTSHVMEVSVRGAPSHELARRVGKAVVNSPLVKTAIYGNDPNVGRLLSAVGDELGSRNAGTDPRTLTIRIADDTVYRDGAFTISRETEIHLSDYLKSVALNPRLNGYPQHQRVVDISIDLGAGDGTATIWGADLSDQYVHENADYRT
jgi:glutamate N-acetyltransferase/amino-acid N-acetyltransferase